ncbi:putative succinate dehydrogenase cytochrome b-558 subunit [Waddlia chondrophila 2032/99]|uniref:Putative succinate dehydrogenase cytochrome b-558 subunit n=1 Tax=Waddlia chondrophila 2032/99 TaxID=765953 RepID=F8LFG4_9BACT|nr:putative succinate dehydrogenase cytochrome b-558 subunit [Waddlia chondrophila 2032/99]
MAVETSVPKAFFWRRIHSLTGIWLVIFLLEHLLTNSQAALWIGDDGSGFVHMVTKIHNLPYLPVIEIGLLGVPILIHGIWGIQYLRDASINSFKTDGSRPSLHMYKRNKAYTWQRITSFVLLFGIIAHVVQMRFVNQPISATVDGQHHYMVRVGFDEGLYTLSKRLDFKVYNEQAVEVEKKMAPDVKEFLGDNWLSFFDFRKIPEGYELLERQKVLEKDEFVRALTARPLENGEVIVAAHDFATAMLLVVRETFKWPLMMVLYTIFVLSACFHAFNGLWTFLITWGVSLTERSQKLMSGIANTLMIVVAFLGLAAIWGTYWVNLRF